jgi:hypothetical protein
LFKRILLTAVLGAGLVFSVTHTAQADHKRDGDRNRRDHSGVVLAGGYYGGYAGYDDTYPFMHYRGWDKSPDLYWYPAGYGAGAPYLQGYYGAPVLTDVFGDDYYFAYGYRCNGYRDGYYYGADGEPIAYYGRPFYRRNADCDSWYNRHGSWYGANDCSRFDVEEGYCED